ncbi:alpha/beta fold hydrolase [Alkalihalobacillus pseudalcaliphilus]|uniref:alpha/beta fold hydrolase n=1 Tax=Alkalihalobacillus pseudalcaliphilus TaxID=79884 RepID=UPI00064DEBB5|nr:alpha/beta fold hydrolase [Alkalihalobacillus pseudalcaliphilus]KMK76680.1 acetyl esterase [Alkalihalobacillus pseudalcaliphilus]
MPLIDMSLDRLKLYEGINPKPADFERFWESSLEELSLVPLQYELIESDFQTEFAKCYHMYFTGIDDARIHVKMVVPKSAIKKQAAILKFHGYKGNSGDWTSILSLASLGHCVFAMDVRGQGGYSEDVGGVIGNTVQGHIIRGLDNENPNKLFYRSVFLDTVQLAKIVQSFDFIDENRIGVTGWSQGGGLALACAALFPQIKKVATVYPFLSDYQRVWEMDLAQGAYEELRTYFRLFDPEHQRKDKVFEKLGYIDIQHLTSRINAEVHIGIGLMDTICPPSTQFAAFNKINAKRIFHIYPDFGHEGLPGHFDKIHQFFEDL